MRGAHEQFKLIVWCMNIFMHARFSVGSVACTDKPMNYTYVSELRVLILQQT